MKQVKQPLTIAFNEQSIDVKVKLGFSPLLLIFSLSLFSFKNEPIAVMPGHFKQAAISTQKPGTDPWVLDKVVGNVEFYHMIAECNGRKAVFLKLNNKNNYRVKVSWKESFDTQFEKKAKSFVGQKQFVLSKGEFVQGGCNTEKFKEGTIKSEQITPTYIADVQGFEFANIKVIKVQ